jgi:hypothetical protein
MSKGSARSPTAVASGSTDALGEAEIRSCTAKSGTTIILSSDITTCTPHSMTTPGSPTPNCCPTNAKTPRPRSGVAPWPGSPQPASPRRGSHRQRTLLPINTVRRGTRRGQTQVDPALPTVNQRQGGAISPHPGRRMGLRLSLPHRHRTLRSLYHLATHLQSPPRPHRTRRPTTHQPRTQPLRSLQLGVVERQSSPADDDDARLCFARTMA